MPVTSAYRCPAHNAAVSTTGANGPHTTGHAVDVAMAGEDTFLLMAMATALGFTGVGIKQHGPWCDRFIHIDLLPVNRPRVWSYQ